MDFSYELQVLMLIGINMLMALSLNLINGITGQFSMGHAGFMAIGAYVSAALTFYGDPVIAAAMGSLLPLPVLETAWFIVAMLGGGLAAAIAGLLVGLPSLRLRGDYLAMTTLGFGEIIRVIILNIDAVGGARGFTGISERTNFFWVFSILFGTVWLIRNVMRSPKGKALLAIREDEIAANSIGIRTTQYKVMAFVAGAFFAGLGGALFAHSFTYLNPSSFNFLKSFEYIVMVVLGGMGSIWGTLIAASVLTLLPELLRFMNEYRMVFYALVLIGVMIVKQKRAEKNHV